MPESSVPMETTYLERRLRVVQGDITRQGVDAIVNAANEGLQGGGGVDGAIRRAAGPGLGEECRRLGGCPTGEARLTGGYNLPAKNVLHTVGPVWKGGLTASVVRLLGRATDDELLARCYRSCFELASRHDLRSLAFPSISTGVYGFPVQRAARIAVREIAAGLQRNPTIEKVLVVCFDDRTFDTYLVAANELGLQRTGGVTQGA
jgi:O-acetyl-ADP-ribose deacetylase (regulator of RNase III)